MPLPPPTVRDDARIGAASGGTTWLPSGWKIPSWKSVLAAGAAIVFGYAASINYFPDLDLGTSATLFAAIALFGALVLASFALTFAAPAFVWLQIATLSRGVTRVVLRAPHEWQRVAWFGVPLFAYLTCAAAVLLCIHGRNTQGGQLLGLGVVISALTGLAGLHAEVGLARKWARKFGPVRPQRARTAERRKARRWRRTGLAVAFGAAAAASAFMLSISSVVLLMLAPQARSDASQTEPGVGTLLAVIVAVLAMNAVFVLDPRPASGGTPRSSVRPQLYTIGALRWRMFVGGMLVFFVLTAFGRWTWLAERVMWRFGLGGVANASLVLDKSGCAIARVVGVLDPPADSSKDSEVCRLDGVTIDLRVGTTYVLRVPNATADSARRRFVLPRDRVLSFVSPPNPPVPGGTSASPPVRRPPPPKSPAPSPPAGTDPP